jgi:hypothetical protein
MHSAVFPQTAVERAVALNQGPTAVGPARNLYKRLPANSTTRAHVSPALGIARAVALPRYLSVAVISPSSLPNADRCRRTGVSPLGSSAGLGEPA